MKLLDAFFSSPVGHWALTNLSFGQFLLISFVLVAVVLLFVGTMLQNMINRRSEPVEMHELSSQQVVTNG